MQGFLNWSLWKINALVKDNAWLQATGIYTCTAQVTSFYYLNQELVMAYSIRIKAKYTKLAISIQLLKNAYHWYIYTWANRCTCIIMYMPHPLPPHTHRRTYARIHIHIHASTQTHTHSYYLSVFSTDFPLVTCYPSSSASYWCWLAVVNMLRMSIC